MLDRGEPDAAVLANFDERDVGEARNEQLHHGIERLVGCTECGETFTELCQHFKMTLAFAQHLLDASALGDLSLEQRVCFLEEFGLLLLDDALNAQFLERFALGDVDDGSQDELPLRGIDRIESDLYRELHPVLAPGVEVATGAHRASRRRGGIACTLERVMLAEALGDEDFDLLTHHLGGRVAEQMLGLNVDERDATRCIDRYDRDRQRVEPQAEWLRVEVDKEPPRARSLDSLKHIPS